MPSRFYGLSSVRTGRMYLIRGYSGELCYSNADYVASLRKCACCNYYVLFGSYKLYRSYKRFLSFVLDIPICNTCQHQQPEFANSWRCLGDCHIDYRRSQRGTDVVVSGDFGKVCNGCIKLNGGLRVCDGCDRKHFKDGALKLRGGTFCPVCAEDKGYSACCSCNEWVSGGDNYSHDGEDYCQTCFDDRFSYCDDCAEYVCIDDYYGHRRCNNCQEIYEEANRDDDDDDEEDDDSVIQSYDYRPSPAFFGKGPYFFGVELEVNSPSSGKREVHAELITNAMNKDGRHVYPKADGSLSCGFEVVTNPHDLAEHRKLWKVFSDNRPHGMTSFEGGDCGLHIHVNRDALMRGTSDLLVRKLVYFVNDPANKEYVEIIAQRETERWAKVFKKTLTNSFTKYRGRTVYNITHNSDNDGRYHAINLTPINTIEFRIFKGNVRYDRIMKNLEFVQALILFCDANSLSDLTHTKFIDWVSSNKRQYSYLHNFHVEKTLIETKASRFRDVTDAPLIAASKALQAEA